MEVIRGPRAGELEDELSGRTRRSRSGSKLGGRRPSFSGGGVGVGEVAGGTAGGERLFGGDGVETPLRGNGQGGEDGEDGEKTPTEASKVSLLSVTGGEREEGEEEEEDGLLEVTTASDLKDLGRLGEGASGEVRRVLHVPSGTVMAKKVRFSS